VKSYTYLARLELERTGKLHDRERAPARPGKIRGSSARVHALKGLAVDTTEAYQRALDASGLPPEHFRLRAMLLGRLLPPPRKGGTIGITR
jgi:hypothetical protein